VFTTSNPSPDAHEQIAAMTEEHDVVTPIPGRASLRLDTGELSPSETTDRIIEHYRLPQAGPTS
jgi:RNase adaptor protein for sRNA GlmZ degradation